MQIFSFVLIGVIIWISLTKRNKDVYMYIFALTVSVEINNISGYFYKIGSFEVSYTDFLQVILLFYSFFRIKRIDKKKLLALFKMLCCCLIGAVISEVFKSDIYVVDTYKTSWDELLFYKIGTRTKIEIGIHTLMIFVRIVIWGVIGLSVYEIDDHNKESVNKTIINFSKLHIIFAILEMATKTFFHLNIMTEFRNLFFGLGNSTYSALAKRSEGALFVIYGFTREPSHFAESMFLFAFIILISKNYKKMFKWFVMALLLMFISMSFSCLMYILTLIITFMFIENRKLTKNNFFIILIILLIVLLTISIGVFNFSNINYYISRIDEFISALREIILGKKLTDVTSSLVRLYSISESLKVFSLRPLFGIGIGTTYCYSGVVSILTNIGIIGFISWLNYLLKCSLNKILIPKHKIITIILILMPNIFKGGLGLMYYVYIYYLLRIIFLNMQISDTERRI